MKWFNKMTKEDKIKEAWKSNYDEFSDYIDSDGWAKYPDFQKHEMIEDIRPIEFKRNGLGFRPESLQGIENNNSWIRIESEADLPKDSGFYLTVSRINNQIDVDYINFDYECHGERWIEFNSHYQPIEKPKPPIY